MRRTVRLTSSGMLRMPRRPAAFVIAIAMTGSTTPTAAAARLPSSKVTFAGFDALIILRNELDLDKQRRIVGSHIEAEVNF